MPRETRRVRRPARRLRPGEQRRRAEVRRAVIILSCAGAVIVVMAALLYLGRTPRLDVASGCPSGQITPPQATEVLIDQTDSLSARQIDYVKALILAEYDRLSPAGKLTVRSIRADPADETQFARCRVRRGTEVSAITANPDMIEQSFRQTVGDALNSFINGLRHVPPAPRSPILESVDAALDTPDFGPTVKGRRLVIVSDMAQNSSADSMYKGPGSGLELSDAAKDNLSRDMHGVVVRIHYVRRPSLGEIQTARQRAFWTDWFEGQGANVKLGWGLQLVDPRPHKGR
jgi:hypothetical protein